MYTERRDKHDDDIDDDGGGGGGGGIKLNSVSIKSCLGEINHKFNFLIISFERFKLRSATFKSNLRNFS